MVAYGITVFGRIFKRRFDERIAVDCGGEPKEAWERVSCIDPVWAVKYVAVLRGPFYTWFG